MILGLVSCEAINSFGVLKANLYAKMEFAFKFKKLRN